MAKSGIRVSDDSPVIYEKSIVIDKNGVPWVVDPGKGTVRLADVQIPAVKKNKK